MPLKNKAAERDRKTEKVYRKPKPVPPKNKAAERDRKTEAVYDKKPRRRVSQVEKPRRPEPMIRPGVGPVAQLSSQAAHTYGFTPEAYNELASIPTHLGPPEGDDDPETKAWYIEPGRDDGGERIRLVDEYGGNDPNTLAHEQTHGWWWRHGLNDPAVQPAYNEAFNDWADSSSDNPAKRTQEFFGGEDYPSRMRSMENHARTLDRWPTAERQEWPNEIRPYYSGFLQGMDRLQDGRLTPPPPRDPNIPRWR
jgi:hypothetical protein